MKKAAMVLFASFLLLFLLAPCSFGEELQPSDIVDIIPDELEDRFEGDDPFSYDYLKDFDGEFFIGYILSSSYGAVSGFVAFLLELILIMLVSGLLESISSSFGSGLGSAVSYVPLLCCSVTVFVRLDAHFAALGEALHGISSLLGALSPVMSGVFLSGGNVNSAAVAASETLLVMNVINALTDYVLMPVLRVCFLLECVSLLSGRREISSVATFTKNGFVYLSTALMTVLTSVFTYQTSVASGADSWILRSTRFAANSIPVVGGAISEAAMTLFGSFEVIKGVSGGVGIVVILLTVIPPLVELVLLKTALFFAGMISSSLGAVSLCPVFEGAGQIAGFAIAVMSVMCVGGIFTLTLIISMGG